MTLDRCKGTFVGGAEDGLEVPEAVVLWFFDLLEVVAVGMFPEGFEEGLRGWSFRDCLWVGDA